MTRPTAERLAEILYDVASEERYLYSHDGDDLRSLRDRRDLLAELDALNAELAEARDTIATARAGLAAALRRYVHDGASTDAPKREVPTR